MRLYDVAVLGAGPAGCAAAIRLGQMARAVALIERARPGQERAGETVPPEICRPLRELGVWESFCADGHSPAAGIGSVWGSSQRAETDHLFNPYGHGWVLDRGRFDTMLAQAAEDAGADFLSDTPVTGCRLTEDDSWEISGIREGNRFRLSARFLVDATGRTGARFGCNGHRLHADRLIGAVKVLRPTTAAVERDVRPLIESAETGWWYSTWLPDGRLVAAFMTDPDLLAGDTRKRAAAWLARSRETAHTRARLATCEPEVPLRIFPAGTSRAEPVAGPGWMAIGDAAMSLDPLSGQGIYHALQSGLAAASIVAEPRDQALAHYAAEVAAAFAASRKTQAAYYAQERRWPASVFWRRRQSPALTPTPRAPRLARA